MRKNIEEEEKSMRIHETDAVRQTLSVTSLRACAKGGSWLLLGRNPVLRTRTCPVQCISIAQNGLSSADSDGNGFADSCLCLPVGV